VSDNPNKLAALASLFGKLPHAFAAKGQSSMFLFLQGLAMTLGFLLGMPGGSGFAHMSGGGGSVVAPADGGGGTMPGAAPSDGGGGGG
jgi:hypothetical protein